MEGNGTVDVNLLNRDGKANKAEIVRRVAKETGSRDVDTILAACRLRLSNLPVESRRGVVFHRHNVSQTLGKRKSRVRHGRTGEVNGSAAAPVFARPISPPPPDTYGIPELLAAKALLAACGNSLYRATTAVKVVADLTLKESARG